MRLSFLLRIRGTPTHPTKCHRAIPTLHPNPELILRSREIPIILRRSNLCIARRMLPMFPMPKRAPIMLHRIVLLLLLTPHPRRSCPQQIRQCRNYFHTPPVKNWKPPGAMFRWTRARMTLYLLGVCPRSISIAPESSSRRGLTAKLLSSPAWLLSGKIQALALWRRNERLVASLTCGRV